MNAVLYEKNGQIARKAHRCLLCGESINIGERKDFRKGVTDGAMWSMHLHPECHAYELTDAFDPDWYEFGDCEPAFNRADAIAAMGARK